jgi:hypothetical protein
MRAVALAAGLLLGCADELTPIPGTTTRVAPAEAQDKAELELRIFTTPDACKGAGITDDELELCLPHVDRASGEVRLGYQFRLNGEVYTLPNHKEQLDVIHAGTLVQDGVNGQAFTVIPHDPEPVKQLYVLVIDGSTSMLEDDRIKKVRGALRMPEVAAAFFPETVETGLILLQFTQGAPRPVGGELKVLRSRAEYLEMVQKIDVLNGYTHLFDAVTFASGPLLKEKLVNDMIELEGMGVTVIALTDGFNNISAADTCRDNAPRLQALLGHLETMRGEGVDLRRRPNVYTVGLGRPLRPRFEVPGRTGGEVRPIDLCGRRFVDRRIDGDIETLGIDNASLAWIARVGGGLSYVRRDRDGLAKAFADAAPKRYRWFEVRYRTDSFYLRRSFQTELRLNSWARAEAKVRLHPSAWLDAPPGVPGEDGWARRQSYLHTATVVVPLIGLLVALGHMGAALFNTQRALFSLVRRPAPRKGP